VETTPFKTCPNCSRLWKTLEDFLSDPELVLAGYQVAFEDLEGGLFYFNHLHNNCGTTLGLPVQEFTGLSRRPFLSPRGEHPGGKCSGFVCAQGRSEPLSGGMRMRLGTGNYADHFPLEKAGGLENFTIDNP